MRALILTILASLSAVTSAQHSAAQSAQIVICPLLLPAGTAAEAKPMPGWKLFMPQEIRITGGGLVTGEPDGQAYLKPLTVRTRKADGKTIEVQSWELGQPQGFPQWLYCEYGHGLQLFRRIDSHAAKCSMTGTWEPGALNDLRFDCR
ncbi:MAG: hypothetical protein H7Y28_14940 [Rhodoferax sp.]|nr:hypothetical protein [Rhodoferax sp.]